MMWCELQLGEGLGLPLPLPRLHTLHVLRRYFYRRFVGRYLPYPSPPYSAVGRSSGRGLIPPPQVHTRTSLVTEAKSNINLFKASANITFYNFCLSCLSCVYHKNVKFSQFFLHIFILHVLIYFLLITFCLKKSGIK